jgi:hypothetical protein
MNEETRTRCTYFVHTYIHTYMKHNAYSPPHPQTQEQRQTRPDQTRPDETRRDGTTSPLSLLSLKRKSGAGDAHP